MTVSPFQSFGHEEGVGHGRAILGRGRIGGGVLACGGVADDFERAVTRAGEQAGLDREVVALVSFLLPSTTAAGGGPLVADHDAERGREDAAVVIRVGGDHVIQAGLGTLRPGLAEREGVGGIRGERVLLVPHGQLFRRDGDEGFLEDGLGLPELEVAVEPRVHQLAADLVVVVVEGAGTRRRRCPRRRRGRRSS